MCIQLMNTVAPNWLKCKEMEKRTKVLQAYCYFSFPAKSGFKRTFNSITDRNIIVRLQCMKHWHSSEGVGFIYTYQS